MKTLPKIAFVGSISSGKSSIINALLGKYVAKSSLVRSTLELNEYEISEELTPISPLLGSYAAAADFPGLDDAEESKDKFTKIIRDKIENYEVVCIVTSAEYLIRASEYSLILSVTRIIKEKNIEGKPPYSFMILINKIDDESDSEKREVLARTLMKLQGSSIKSIDEAYDLLPKHSRMYSFSAYSCIAKYSPEEDGAPSLEKFIASSKFNFEGMSESEKINIFHLSVIQRLKKITDRKNIEATFIAAIRTRSENMSKYSKRIKINHLDKLWNDFCNASYIYQKDYNKLRDAFAEIEVGAKLPDARTKYRGAVYDKMHIDLLHLVAATVDPEYLSGIKPPLLNIEILLLSMKIKGEELKITNYSSHQGYSLELMSARAEELCMDHINYLGEFKHVSLQSILGAHEHRKDKCIMVEKIKVENIFTDIKKWRLLDNVYLVEDNVWREFQIRSSEYRFVLFAVVYDINTYLYVSERISGVVMKSARYVTYKADPVAISMLETFEAECRNIKREDILKTIVLAEEQKLSQLGKLLREELSKF